MNRLSHGEFHTKQTQYRKRVHTRNIKETARMGNLHTILFCISVVYRTQVMLQCLVGLKVGRYYYWTRAEKVYGWEIRIS